MQKNITESVVYIGADDRSIDLFEGQYVVPEGMTYNYYQNNVKPKPETDKKGFVCNVCGFIYEGDKLPDDYICPLCKHGVDDFSPIG